MVASPLPRTPRTFVSPKTKTTTAPSSTGGVTSGLISQLAVVALKRRLKNQTGVKCDACANPADMLRGRVGPVTVKGRGWESELGLSCRGIEASVDICELDLGKIISHQKLRLIEPAKGSAMVALNGNDFANFITHPLMKPPCLPVVDGNCKVGEPGIAFIKDNVHIDAETGTVTFYGKYLGQTWQLSLQRGSVQQRALVTVKPHEPSPSSSQDLESIAQLLTKCVSDFFNEMVFELDGTFLTFKDMMTTDKGPEPTLMLALNISVRKFPSPGLAF
eukprot:CAMPEP_0116825082 /NCGR_PEP_ID=MMETSP0418-20121206/1761_1 /TAXON_ID=1158023 /ORGANISM="Astrosyne radiata, Strain 13vi08-1A" /LENGTH=275 /DNA_ID=CAMNT_0004453537 /DNA_START=179 /DNA_END=1006 /DNA_ORIENTATION=-